MSAIITDQIRILNAKNFVSAASTTKNSYYTFIGLPNPTDYFNDWDISTPAPKDSFEQEYDYWDTMISLKRIKSSDVNYVVRKLLWNSGSTYDMYRHDISRSKLANSSGATSLYSANYYIVNSEYKVYICLQNGTSYPDYPNGRPSLDEPTFTDLEPKAAGKSGDGYIWKYLYTIKPSEVIKFDSVDYIPVPKDWETSLEFYPIRNNALSENNQLKIAVITNKGSNLGAPNKIYNDIPIKGDGFGAKATIVIDNSSKVESITISSGGSGYTYGTVDFTDTDFPIGNDSIAPTFDIIIPPKGGHGADIYRELGAHYVLLFSRFETGSDFTVGNKIARIGIVENPQAFNSTSALDVDTASVAYALKLTGLAYSTTTFTPNSTFTQTIGSGTTAVGRVISYDKNTGVLKYWQDKSLVGFNTDGTPKVTTDYGFNLNRFTNSVGLGGTTLINDNSNLKIDTTFSGITTTINNRTYDFGQYFENGISNPEVKKYSGNIIYVDNRPSITRSLSQKEDIKVILQF